MLPPALVLAELFWVCQDKFELSQPKLASQPSQLSFSTKPFSRVSQPNPTYKNKVSGQDLVSGGRRRNTTTTIIIIIPS
jgi:hypothetical protein